MRFIFSFLSLILFILGSQALGFIGLNHDSLGSGGPGVLPSINILPDSLPDVLPKGHSDLVESRLRLEAALRFGSHQLPATRQRWETYQSSLRNEIIKKAGIIIDRDLPLNYRETGTIKLEGLTIRNITFQTRPGVYATANLYVPEGKGPFPAVVNMHGHWPQGRLAERVQERGFALALSGYVCLSIDAFGSGERSTVHGEYEYHGAQLGASLMNIGESLLGFQVSDNMRAIDLLASLPYVDKNRIGATGASGGGNQTMWLTAVDERVRSSMPVVSVGTFESAVMRSNCICELLVDGLTFTETSGVLALIAPRSIKMCNHKKDDNPTFFPEEMLRTYHEASPVFEMLGAADKISYQVFDLEHGYWPEDREAMLGWFNLHLKGLGNGAPLKEPAFQTLQEEKLMVYSKGRRDPGVETISGYCKRMGSELRRRFLSERSFDRSRKKEELQDILGISARLAIKNLKKVHQFSSQDGWDRLALETSDSRLIPLLHFPPGDKSRPYVIVCNPAGKANIHLPVIDEMKKSGSGILIADLSGTGELSKGNEGGRMHTLSRAELWLGRTVLGEWANELGLVTEYARSTYGAGKVTIDGGKEGGLSALFLGALDGNIDEIILRNAPASYLFDSREGVDYFSMAVYLPGFLQWGDVSLAAALSGSKITFIEPVSMSGKPLDTNASAESLSEFEALKKVCRGSGQTVFDR